MKTASSSPATGESAARPALIGRGDMRCGPALDAFPAGAKLCVLHGDPRASGPFTVRLKVFQRYVFAPAAKP